MSEACRTDSSLGVVSALKPHNNGMHPDAQRAPFILRSGGLGVECMAGGAGRSIDITALPVFNSAFPRSFSQPRILQAHT